MIQFVKIQPQVILKLPWPHMKRTIVKICYLESFCLFSPLVQGSYVLGNQCNVLGGTNV